MRSLFSTLVLVGAFSFLLLVSACQSSDQTYVPKPKGYNRLALPSHSYQPLTERHPYNFMYSRHATILPDTFADAEPHWIFVHYPQLKANVQLTYKEIKNDPKRLKDFIDDAYKLAGKHQIRASSIKEQTIQTRSGRTATLFQLEGDVPSPFQFYTTDSSRHFLRGAIYFPTATKNDSLAPVIDYIQQDLMRMLNTLQWQ
ncbi:gliding motility lipoprotein GldD [Telluribacter sp.]|jgi:gliding motility-associated lipoprotein GldD|uniref:gliding motility lipoprotein GldD n=1 Tax=Telluribacter sp. TaxID=1978767 RepID=UPI002E153B17|nr:gliding motility lipoprotein GldD [Telluribacter sp.]